MHFPCLISLFLLMFIPFLQDMQFLIPFPDKDFPPEQKIT